MKRIVKKHPLIEREQAVETVEVVEEDETEVAGFEMSQIRPLMSTEEKQQALDEIMRVLRGE